MSKTIEQIVGEAVIGQVSKCGTSQQCANEPRRQIVCMSRGFVAVGDVSRSGDDVVIENASIIRRWGTTSGLGQLAASGKQPNTVLDPAGTIRANIHTVALRIDVKPGVSLG